ncbi:alpha/beta hydrolase [Euzebya tangerina]|uniref:alpha/beta hydrolase n=1 Tax=Euzebya tangerina TaxID=591198 RepID=UPI000E30C97A|nr:alpha/beta hydrolase [Euzebya tangerina]
MDRLLRLGLIVLGVVIAVAAVLWLAQRRLIFLPDRAVPATPDLVEAVELTTTDGLSLDAWFLPADGAGPVATVAIFNGNAGNRANRLALGRALAREGFGVLLTDYRGYGGNPGTPSEAGLALDALAAHDFLRSRHDVDTDRLIYFGESLGAAVAIGLAVDHPPAALVLRSPFTSLADVAAVHFPFLPTGLLLRDRFANLERVPSVEAPVLVIAGTDDRIVPRGQSRQVHDAAGGPTQFVEVDGAGHNDAALVAGPMVVDAVTAFADRLGMGAGD